MPFLSLSNLGSEAPNWPSEIRGVGVELEGMMTEEDYDRLRRDTGTLAGSEAPGVLDVGGDGSIRPTSAYPCAVEIRTWGRTPGELWSAITRAYGFGLRVNASCGGHVHMSFAKNSLTPISLLDPWAERSLLAAYAAFTASQAHRVSYYRGRMRSRWCEFEPSRPWNQRLNETRGYGNRYRAINPCAWDRHGTIEFRLLPAARTWQEAVRNVAWLVGWVGAWASQYVPHIEYRGPSQFVDVEPPSIEGTMSVREGSLCVE